MPNIEDLRSTRVDADKTQLLMRRILDSIHRQPFPQSAITQPSTHEELRDIIASINRVTSAQQRLDALLHASLRQVPAAQQGALYLGTSRNHVFMIAAAFPGESEQVGSEIEALGGYIDAVAQLQCPVLITDAQEEELAAYPGQASRSLHPRSALVVPFIVGGRTIGVLSLENCEQPQAFTRDELDLMALLAEHAALAVDHARLSMDWAALFPAQPFASSIWQELVQRIPLGTILLDQQRNFVWANQAFLEMTGLSRGELEANGIEACGLWPGNTGAPAEDGIGQVQELSLTRQDGTSCPVRAILWDLNAGNIPGVNGYLGVLQDQSQQRDLENKLFHLQRLSNVGAVLSAVSHELNNPLTAVIGFSELVLTRQDIPAECREDLGTIVNHAERSVQIVRDLLDYVHLQSDAPMQVNVNDLIRQVVRFRNHTLKQNGLRIVSDLAQDLPSIQGYARQLQQVILNLITNAEQASTAAHGEGKVWIRTFYVKDCNCVRISLRDNGPGIPPEVQSRIFEPFFTTKKSGEGTGLGLSISRQIVERHNGRIWYENEPGPGAHFCIELPALSDLDAVACGRSTRSAEQADVRVARVLVVDDEKSIGRLLCKVLTKQGHSVEVAFNGEEALHRLQENVYDVLFLDLKIPDLPGQEIYAQVKAHHAELAKHTVILTGDTLNATTAAFLRQENMVHLLKPFQLSELRAAMEEVWPDRQPPGEV
jgi:PAS domain S-box-containing protein